jgi:outer membrane protein OmpA-like peptidoglycan-associated protein
MNKVMICLIVCFLSALTTVRAQDAGRPAADTTRSASDTTGQTQPHATGIRDTIPSQPVPDTSFRYHGDSAAAAKDTVISLADDSPAVKKDIPADKKDKPLVKVDVKSSAPADSSTTVTNNIKVNMNGKTDSSTTTTGTPPATGVTQASYVTPVAPKDTATPQDRQEETTRRLDDRWFISPLLKMQFQDYAMLEKNREGYLSNANTLPFFQRGNASFAASAYKNITQRLSVSADLGLSFGHVTSNNVEISQTKSMTFNLLNAAIYYHLISPAYRLQPYVTIGINELISNGSYATIPMGIGAKFNGRKIMILGQVTYGYGLTSNNASTTMYALGVYLPIKNKKHKQLDDDNSPYNRDAKKKDSTSKSNVTNNIYITINMDSVLRAKGLLDSAGNPIAGRGYGDDDDNNPRRRRRKPFNSLGLDDFNDDDYSIDSLDGKPTLHFVVYFEFNDYGLNTRAFGAIDKVIAHLKRSPDFTVEIKGYTDSVGSDHFNNLLSRKRATMVLEYMNSRGIPTELMKAKAYGKDNPVADNTDPNKAWLNRRAEIIVHRKEGVASQIKN